MGSRPRGKAGEPRSDPSLSSPSSFLRRPIFWAAGAFLAGSLIPAGAIEAGGRFPAARAVLVTPQGEEENLEVFRLRFVHHRRRVIQRRTWRKREEGGRPRTDVRVRPVDRRMESRSLLWESARRIRLRSLREITFRYQGEEGKGDLVLILTLRGGREIRRKARDLRGAFHPSEVRFSGRVDGRKRDLFLPPIFQEASGRSEPVLKRLRILRKGDLPRPG